MNPPKILIVVEKGCARVIASTADVEVHIIDRDTQSGFACHEQIGHYSPISDEHFLESIEENSCPICAYCNRLITSKEDEESTHCGSMHRDCLPEHAGECGICRKDFEERV